MNMRKNIHINILCVCDNVHLHLCIYYYRLIVSWESHVGFYPVLYNNRRGLSILKILISACSVCVLFGTYTSYLGTADLKKFPCQLLVLLLLFISWN